MPPLHRRGCLRSGVSLVAYAFAIACGGTTTAPAPVPTPGATGRFLYAASPSGPTLRSWSIEATTGRLTAIGETSLSGGARALSVVTDPSGRFLFVSRSGGRGGIDVFGINGQSGVLTLAAGAPFDVDHQADSLVADPSGRFLFAVRTFNFATESFAIDPTSGALSSSPGRRLDLDDAPTAPVLRPDGRVLYYGAGSGARVRSASVDTVTGVLIQGGSTEVQDNVRALAVAPTGSFLYVTTATPLSSNTLFAYRITQATGALTSLSGTAFASGFDAAGANFRPDTVAFDPVGRFAYILDRPGRTGAHSRGVFVFPLQSTGLFGPSVLGPFSTPPTEPFLNGDPVAFVLDPSGRFAYIADATSGTISAFTIDPLTGSLSPSGPPIAASGIAGAPLIAITP